MKKWLPLLLLPLCGGAGLGYRALAWSQETAPDIQSQAAPNIQSQSELDAYRRSHPNANLDKLGHAFGNTESGLFWNTDWEAAKRQAAREGKPILSLRLLGNLSDEYSCANSRFFRVVFYPQQAINARLKRDFVLFWSSERPVPVMTIDMGDGRILKRTVTGNSAHYLLDSNGRPLDVFPGLSTPKAFDSWLASSQKLAQNFNAQPVATRDAWLAKWHDGQLRESLKTGRRIVQPAALENQVKTVIDHNPLEATTPVLAVPAQNAAPFAVTKMVLEAPLINGLPPVFLDAEFSISPGNILDEPTRARIRAMNPFAAIPTEKGAPLGVQQVSLSQTQKRQTSDARFDTLIRSFESTLLADTRQNQRFATSIHALFARGHEGDFQELNRRIYDRLFLTPKSDPWLGLASDNAFSGLQDNGVTMPTRQNTEEN